MSEEPRVRDKIDLAIALARGSSISGWARASGVPRQTAQRWANEKEVRVTIEAYRRRAVDRAVGQLSSRANWAARELCNIAKEAGSQSVKLTAVRAVLRDMVAVSKYTGLEVRMGELEERLREQDGNGKSTGYGERQETSCPA